MNNFIMNGILWRIHEVPTDDPMLIDRTNERRVATTDFTTHDVYLSKDLEGDFKKTVLLHELGHCVMCSFGLLDDIHEAVLPEYWVQAEEWVCNFVADYGGIIFDTAYRTLGEEAWAYIPYGLEKMIK